MATVLVLGDGIQAVLPDPRSIDLRTLGGAVNALVPKELVDRSVRQVDLFDGMREFIQTAYSSFPGYLRQLKEPTQ
jgi:hypothetical protein